MTDHTPNIGELVTQAVDLRERRRELAKADRELKDQLDTLTHLIIAHMDEQGITHGRVGGTSIAVTATEVPTVTDWDQVYTYVRENEAMHLLERRIASAAWRELLGHGLLLPGTEPFKKRDVNLRRV